MYTQLKNCPLFRGLSEDEIRKVLGGDEPHYSLTDYRDGEVIARRDTAYSGLMVILHGKVHGLMQYASGRQRFIEPIHAPQLIAPAFLFGGYNKLPIDVIADGDVSILTIHRGYIFELMQSNVVILSNFIDVISNRANFWSKKIFYLSFCSLQEKVATYLLEQTQEGRCVVAFPDAAETAACFDATRSALERVLKEMEKRHLVRCETTRIEVLNRTGLQDMLK